MMSTMDALEKFMRNPRPYILSPQPRNPCKLCIVGPPLSGKTTLAKRLASKYGATVGLLCKIFESSRLRKKWNYLAVFRSAESTFSLPLMISKRCTKCVLGGAPNITLRMFASWGRERASNNAEKNGQGEGGSLAVCGLPFHCGLWKREEGI